MLLQFRRLYREADRVCALERGWSIEKGVDPLRGEWNHWEGGGSIRLFQPLCSPSAFVPPVLFCPYSRAHAIAEELGSLPRLVLYSGWSEDQLGRCLVSLNWTASSIGGWEFPPENAAPEHQTMQHNSTRSYFIQSSFPPENATPGHQHQGPFSFNQEYLHQAAFLQTRIQIQIQSEGVFHQCTSSPGPLFLHQIPSRALRPDPTLILNPCETVQ